MIQLTGPRQFERAAERIARERHHVARHETNLFRVTNRSKSHTYFVRFERRDGKTFAHCDCEAGHPTTSRRVPIICKHVFAACLFIKAVSGMRRGH